VSPFSRGTDDPGHVAQSSQPGFRPAKPSSKLLHGIPVHIPYTAMVVKVIKVVKVIEVIKVIKVIDVVGRFRALLVPDPAS